MLATPRHLQTCPPLRLRRTRSPWPKSRRRLPAAESQHHLSFDHQICGVSILSLGTTVESEQLHGVPIHIASIQAATITQVSPLPVYSIACPFNCL